MKKIHAGCLFLLKYFCFSVLAVLPWESCSMLGDPEDASAEGELRVSFEGEAGRLTRFSPDIPDTSDFLLTVTGPDGKVVYEGAYGASPESMMVKPGSYTVKVRSCEFVRPAFAMPQFGDEQCVVVPSGGVANVRLTCRQLNCGVILSVDESFLTGCPGGALVLKSSSGSLMYGYSERRAAYFHPGAVSLMLSEGGNDRILMTRLLQPQDMLRIKVSVASSSSSSSESIRVAVDTTRNWLSEEYVIGGGNGGGTDDDGFSDALTVQQAVASSGETDVWVCGYVVGGDLTSTSASFEGPFSSRTNILLGSRSTASDRSSCLSVKLPSGAVRDALNLVDNPSLLGRKVYLKGDIVEAYYGLPGITNITDYEK
ncbi:MAG: DUF4493 domain-containing protein [Bacteroidales bacterium]|nr:DUF4493 domain-containing protein [Bacteroidales bacterium]